MLNAAGMGREGREAVPRRVAGALPMRRGPSAMAAENAAGARVLAIGDDEDEVEGYVRSRRFSGLRFRLRGGIPRSTLGRVMGGVCALGLLGAFTVGLWEARKAMLHDARLVIPSSAAIQISGNRHLSRPQLLSIFGEDVDRNVLTVSLAERRAQLESLPWVDHATVMRLLPNKVRVSIAERTPVAFVRQGSQIGLVDNKGVLLDMAPDVDNHYSFPVVTGISASDPASTRMARMKLFTRFTQELDGGMQGGGEKISKTLSEVDLSSPEDVKALIPSGSSDVLVHFGENDFLPRYERYEKNLPGWKAQYPKLASVDMRYEHQVVLEMKPGAEVPVPAPAADAAAARVATARPKTAPAAKSVAVAKSVAPARATLAAAKPPVTAAKASAVAAKVPAGGHLQTAFDVHTKEADTKSAAQEAPR